MYTLLIVFFLVAIVTSFLCSLWEAVLLSITDQGFGKRTQVSNFNVQGRGGQGVRAHRLPEARGELLSGFLVEDGDERL